MYIEYTYHGSIYTALENFTPVTPSHVDSCTRNTTDGFSVFYYVVDEIAIIAISL